MSEKIEYTLDFFSCRSLDCDDPACGDCHFDGTKSFASIDEATHAYNNAHLHRPHGVFVVTMSKNTFANGGWEADEILPARFCCTPEVMRAEIKQLEREEREYRRDCEREAAMQAGMGGGCDFYNDFYGY